VPRLARLLAVLLLAGTALLGLGAAIHPMLPGDATEQLKVIAATTHWRAIHLVMLTGTALIIAGVWVRLVTDRSGSAVVAIAPLALISLGLAIDALNIAFMAGAGWHMADLFAAGRTDVIPIFEMTHPIGLVAARFGNLIVALGAFALGWVESLDPTKPRWLAWLAWGAAAGGFIGVVVFDESSRLALAAVALLSGWQVATAIRALTDRPTPAT
jgi:hypothetical protein